MSAGTSAVGVVEVKNVVIDAIDLIFMTPYKYSSRSTETDSVESGNKLLRYGSGG